MHVQRALSDVPQRIEKMTSKARTPSGQNNNKPHIDYPHQHSVAIGEINSRVNDSRVQFISGLVQGN